MHHPELPSELNDLIDFVENQQIVDVWCRGCKMYRQMNGVYVKYVTSAGIGSCRFCREADNTET